VVKSLLFIAFGGFCAAWLLGFVVATGVADGDPAIRISVTFRMGDFGSPRLGRAVVERRHRVERLDQVLFWASYWLGTFCGVLAII